MTPDLRSRTEADAAYWARDSWPNDDQPTLADVIDDRPTRAQIATLYDTQQPHVAATTPDPWQAHLDRMNAAADARHAARNESRAA